MKSNSKKVLLQIGVWVWFALLIFQFGSCCRTSDSHMKGRNSEAGVHVIKIETIEDFKQDSQSLLLPNDFYDSVFIEIIENMGGMGKVFFEDELSFNMNIKNHYPQASVSGFDFDNYCLMPLSINIQAFVSNISFQVLGLLDHNKKEIVVHINSRYTTCRSDRSADDINFNNWIKIPRIPHGFKLKGYYNGNEL